jgi:hypothetical protein
MPFDDEVIRSFVTYCISIKKLKPSSVKTYLSAVVHMHKMCGFARYEISDIVAANLIRGSERLQLVAPAAAGAQRRVMTIYLLRHLGHKIATSGWREISKQVVWTACSVAFFTSARMGELLSPAESSFDPATTLTWSCIKYRSDNSFLIQIKVPKSAAKEGEYLDLFEFPRFGCCPVAALKKLMFVKSKSGEINKDEPVFTFDTGKHLTINMLNNLLRDLLADVLVSGRDSISAHSFRAGVPSALMRNPSLASSDDVKGWGRWSSETYQRYTRLRTDQKKSIFEKIMSVLE